MPTKKSDTTFLKVILKHLFSWWKLAKRNVREISTKETIHLAAGIQRRTQIHKRVHIRCRSYEWATRMLSFSGMSRDNLRNWLGSEMHNDCDENTESNLSRALGIPIRTWILVSFVDLKCKFLAKSVMELDSLYQVFTISPFDDTSRCEIFTMQTYLSDTWQYFRKNQRRKS